VIDMKIAVCGNGYLGGSLADNLEDRGFNVTRYSLEPEYVGNKERVKDCEVVFIAVPTPTRAGVFDGSAVLDCLRLCSPNAIAVIKSTVPPNWIREAAEDWALTILYVPEFLDAATAREDTDSPQRNIIGVKDLSGINCLEDEKKLTAANLVLDVLPKAPYVRVCTWEEAALIKYGGNCFFFMKNVFFNLLADVSAELGCEYAYIRDAIAADIRIGPVHTHMEDKGGRGAGGACLPKDMSVFIDTVTDTIGMSDYGTTMLFDAEKRNKKLLEKSGKDPEIVKEVYG